MTPPVNPNPPPAPAPGAINQVIHAVMPIAVIAASTVLACLHVIDSPTAVALIGTAGGYGAFAVVASGKG